MALTPTEEQQVKQLIDQQAALLSLANNEATITSKLAATKVNLSQLSPATTLADNDLMLVRQGTAEKSTTGSVLWNYIKTAIGVATDTITGVARIATQSEINAGTGTNTIVTPARLRLGFAISTAQNGYITFPTWLGGLIIQWGRTTLPSTSQAIGAFAVLGDITFPLAFTNACRSISAITGPGGTGGEDDEMKLTISAVSQSLFSLRTTRLAGTNPGGENVVISWMAIGH